METPEVDLEKFRPKIFHLSQAATDPNNSPSKWVAGSEPLLSQSQSGSKRKYDDCLEDFALRNVSTPDTPYGAFMARPGSKPSPRTKKYYKKQCDELGKFQLPDEEIQRKRAKLDQEANEDASAENDTPNVGPRQVPTPVREKWKDDLEAKGLVVLERDKRRFSDIMEEKANKLGRSWKDPKRRIKIVSSSQSLVESINSVY